MERWFEQPGTLAAFTGHAVIDPHDLYNALRAHDAIYYDPHDQCWVVTGYESCVSILTDPRFSAKLAQDTSEPEPTSTDAAFQAIVNNQITFMAGQQHRAARAAFAKGLAPAVKRAPSTVRSKMEDILAIAREKGELDLVTDFAAPLALHVTADALGIPLDDGELATLSAWSETFGDLASGYVDRDMQDVLDLIDYFRDLLEVKRRSPTDDLLGAMVRAPGAYPSDDDLIANAIMFFAAGQGTTRKLLGTGIPLLLPEWESWRTRVRADNTWIRLLVDEMARVVTPPRYLVRLASEDVDIPRRCAGNRRIRRGDRVFLFLDAANHDPTRFSDPASFCPKRDPTSQLAFGVGPHKCPAASLALLEAHIALEMFFEFTSVRRKANTQPVWNPNHDVGGYASYVVEITL